MRDVCKIRGKVVKDLALFFLPVGWFMLFHGF
jgi:hypothetical protein